MSPLKLGSQNTQSCLPDLPVVVLKVYVELIDVVILERPLLLALLFMVVALLCCSRLRRFVVATAGSLCAWVVLKVSNHMGV